MLAGRGGRVDVAVVGAGIVGLAHACHAVDRGLSVVVVERDARPSGASIRNFGHGYVAAQSGDALAFAIENRRWWRRLSEEAGIWFRESGTLLVARLPEELEVVREFASGNREGASVLSAADARMRAPVAYGLLGALWTPLDFRVDPRSAVPALAEWLGAERGVRFVWDTTAIGVESGHLLTSRGEFEADAIVVAAGHDLDRLVPELAERAEVERCALQMLRVAAPDGRTIEPGLATGLSLFRYSAFSDCVSLPALRERIAVERPELLAHEVNLLVTQLPDGDLLIGDTHRYGAPVSPFRDESLDELLLQESARLLGVGSLSVRERWLGVYAHVSGREFLVESPAPGVRVVAVTSGIGMSTAFGLAGSVLGDLLQESASAAGTLRGRS